MRYVCILALLIVFCACTPRQKYAYTVKAPEKKDIVGTWIPDKSTLMLISSEGKYSQTKNIRVILNNDSSLEIHNMPDWWGVNSDGESHKTFYSCSGKWKLAQKENAVKLGVVCQDTYTELDLLNTQHPYIIEFMIGDPDAGQSMYFIRVEN
jgi:hypothetical protein